MRRVDLSPVGAFRVGRTIGRLVVAGATASVLMAVWTASAQASLAQVPVPYMGWNPYYAKLGGANEATLESVADSLISSGLQKAGYRMFWLDYGWASGARDSSGRLIVNSTQWPTGMSGFTRWLHQHGFLAGVYTDAGPSGCSGEGVGSYGHYQQDADTFAAWGFDAVKVDFCGAGQQLEPEGYTPQELYTQFSQALANNASGRPMILNVCNFWTPGQINGTLPTMANSSWDNFQWAPPIAQSWRTDTDIGFPGNVQFKWVLRNLNKDAANPDAAGPPSSTIAWGHWNDPDYLAPQQGMTNTQAQTQFSMWAMVAAPLILGSDPRTLTTWTRQMLENRNVIAIDQDPLGAQGTIVQQAGSGEVWSRPLANGDRAVALLNTGATSLQITTTAAAVGLPSASSYSALNLWTNKRSTTTGQLSSLVPADGVTLYRVTPS